MPQRSHTCQWTGSTAGQHMRSKAVWRCKIGVKCQHKKACHPPNMQLNATRRLRDSTCVGARDPGHDASESIFAVVDPGWYAGRGTPLAQWGHKG
eukprot:1161474-Pelagomonas_calceolata.AAC.8